MPTKTSRRLQEDPFEAFKKTFDDPEFKKAFDVFGEAPMFAGTNAIKEQIQEESKLTVSPAERMGPLCREIALRGYESP